MRTSDRAGGPADALAILLLAAAAFRLLGGIVAGFIAWSLSSGEFAPANERAGAILSTFGSAGDTAGVLLLVAAVGVIGWARLPGSGLRHVARALLLVTSALICARLAAVYVITGDFSSGAAVQDSLVTGSAVGDLLLCVGSGLVLRRFAESREAPGDEVEPLLFAVDRGNAEVFAFFSYAQARRTISSYSVEEDEYAFYTDEGTVVHVAVGDLGTTFTPTDELRHDELMSSLRRFAQAKDLTVDDPADPTSYAVAICDWQWLELWPGWLRPIGRIVRRLTG